MYLTNKYTKLYHNIIYTAQSRGRNKTKEYYEKHHIIPRSLGGTNQASNLVLLTAREHFICHILLTKMFEVGSNEYYKMLHASMLMRGMNKHQNRYFNSRLYDYTKKKYSEYRSNLRKGQLLSDTHKKNISESLKGHSISDEARRKISEKAKTRKRKKFTEEERARISEAMKESHRRRKLLV